MNTNNNKRDKFRQFDENDDSCGFQNLNPKSFQVYLAYKVGI